MKIFQAALIATAAAKKARSESAVNALESTIQALADDENLIFTDRRFQKNLEKRIGFIKKYYGRSSSCVSNNTPNFYVEPTVGGIARGIRDFHAKIFNGTGKKCDRKRGHERVEKMVRKFEAKKCEKSQPDCDAYARNNKIAFHKDGKIIIGAQSKYEDSVVVFQNIKFGNSARFEHSTVKSFGSMEENGIFDFSAPGKSCMTVAGVNIGAHSLPVETEKVEDCLYAKIVAKKDSVVADDERSVLSWIHGGTFNFGGIDVQYESPDNFVANQDVIVAKVNYRLGPFGNWFFEGGESNFQTLDQRNGLGWIHENIGNFNGNSDSITLGGGSAGGRSVMNHMTNEDSYGYFSNAITIGAPGIPFWSKSQATEIYNNIYNKINEVNPQLGGCFGLYGHKNCLKGLDVATFAGFAGQLGGLFSLYAIENKMITNAESAWYPVIDGDVITAEPLLNFMAGNVKQDLGFYYHEDSRNEGQSMMRNLFSHETIKQAIFGADAYSAIFQNEHVDNSHVVVPKAAYDGFIENFYQSFDGASDALLKDYPEISELMCDEQPILGEGHPANGLLTECLDSMADWASAYMWQCKSSYTFKNSQFGPNTSLYAIEMYAAYPGPNYGEDGVKQISLPEMRDCYHRGTGKSCHVVGQTYLFGEAAHQNIEVTDEELQFEHDYQAMFGNLIKGKQTGLVAFDAENNHATYNKISYDGLEILNGGPFPFTCHIHNAIFPHLIKAGFF